MYYQNFRQKSSFMFSNITTGTFGLNVFGLSLVYIWALRGGPLVGHRNFLDFNGFLILKLLGLIISSVHVRRAQRSWNDPRQHQERLLQEIIKENGDTEYGKLFRMKDINSLDEFRLSHPLTTYEHYRSYVKRMMEGESNILTKKTPTSFVRTTGTTGQSKYIPHTNKIAYLQNHLSIFEHYLAKNIPSFSTLQKQLFLYVHPFLSKTKSGATVESMGTIPDVPDFVLSRYSTPGSGFKINTLYEANYIHFLFGLRNPDIGMLGVSFSSYLESAFIQLKRCWKDIIDDIDHGTINPNLKLPQDIRAKLESAVGEGDPTRATELRREFEKGFTGIIKRIWPRIAVINMIDNTGKWPKMERTFAKGGYCDMS